MFPDLCTPPPPPSPKRNPKKQQKQPLTLELSLLWALFNIFVVELICEGLLLFPQMVPTGHLLAAPPKIRLILSLGLLNSHLEQ